MDVHSFPKGTGSEVHHLVEKRFASIFETKAGSMPSNVLKEGEHQIFTNSWRKEIPYGDGTLNATQATIEAVAREVYKAYPNILRSLGLN